MKIKTKPTDKQVEAAKFLLTKEAALISYGTGTGKSYIMILTAMKLIIDKALDKVLFVVTKSSTLEVQTDFRKRTDQVPFVIQDCHALENFIDTEDERFGIVDYNLFTRIASGYQTFGQGSDLMPSTKKKRVADRSNLLKIKEILSRKRLGVFLDEAHKLKNPQSFLRKMYDALRGCFVRCYGATATPLYRDLEDLFNISQYFDPRVLGTRESFDSCYINWRMQPVTMRGRKTEVRVVGSYKNLELLREKLSGYMITYYPKMKENWKEVRFDIESVDRYEQAALGFLNTIEERGHGARLIDLQRVVDEDVAKRRAFASLLQEIRKEGTIVFCAYYDAIDVVVEIIESIGLQYRTITGKESVDERGSAKDWFWEGVPTDKVLVVTMAGGQSMNLQATNNIIFYNILGTVGYYLQVRGRVVREQSAFDEFNIYFMVGNETVDDYKLEFLKSKKELIEKIQDDDSVPDSEMQGYNSYLMDKIKRAFLWKRKHKTKLDKN